MLVIRAKTAWELINQDKVAHVEQRLRELRAAFLERLAPRALAASEIDAIAAVQPDLIAFGHEIRQRATPFILAGLSGMYWAVNDAFSHFEDAVGTHWPFMDGGDRDKALEFSERMIQASGLV